LYADFTDAELGYAVTGHVAQGRTVRAGLAVFIGSEDRHHAYVALTRGTDQNTAYVFNRPVKLADLSPSARPAPELARYDHLSDHAGGPDQVDPDDPGSTSPARVLAEIIAGRDGARQSAAQAWRQALSDADHLAVLHAMWTTETRPVREQRYRALLQAALPPGTEPWQPSHKEQCLHRTLRAAELADLDPGEVLARAVAERSLVGARDVAAVIDARIRRGYDLVPRPAVAWSTQVPQTGDLERSRFLAQLAAVMDDRRRRIGEHAAASSLPWAVAALGPVPDEPAARLAWQQKAAAIGTYRELSGHDHPDDPVGPEPAANNPDLRAAWHAARAALTPDHARASGTASRHAHAEVGAAHSHGEHDGAVRQTGQRPGHGQESRLPDLAEASSRIGELAARRRELIAGMAERHSVAVPGEDRGLRLGTSLAFPLEHAHHRAAMLQPPKPDIQPSAWIQERLAGRDLDREAAD
jgi:hypothetical protein